jgi:hypothetical protein
MLQVHQADAQTRAAGVIGHRVAQSLPLRFVERPLKFAWNAMTGSSSVVLTCLVIVLALILAARFVLHLKRERPGWKVPSIPIEDLPLWIVSGHVLVYSCFFTYSAVRLFVPLIPLVIVWLMMRATSLSEEIAGRRSSRVALAALTILVVTANLGHAHTFRTSMASRFDSWFPFSLRMDFKLGDGLATLRDELTKKSWTRQRFEELGPVVDENARLLVGASTVHPFPGRRSLQIGYYFGDNAVYLFDHDEPLDRLIETKRIGFVLFTPFQVVNRPANDFGDWQRYRYDGRWGPRRPIVLGQSLGFEAGEYTIQAEFLRLRSHLARRGARLIDGQRGLLTKNPTVLDPISFVVWVLDPKLWPPLDRELQAISSSLEAASEGRVFEALSILEAADAGEISDLGRFRLRLTAARIQADDDRPGKARASVGDAMALLPRNTTVATVLRDAYPTRGATEEISLLFAGLHETKPRHRGLRDLLLSLDLNLAEFALEEGDRPGLIDSCRSIERRLGIPGNVRFASAITEWCGTVGRTLEREGRSVEAEACLSASRVRLAAKSRGNPSAAGAGSGD